MNPNKNAGTCKAIAYSKGRGGTKWPTTCGRPIKRDGKCGIHARMDEQQRASWLTYVQETKAARAAEAERAAIARAKAAEVKAMRDRERGTIEAHLGRKMDPL